MPPALAEEAKKNVHQEGKGDGDAPHGNLYEMEPDREEDDVCAVCLSRVEETTRCVLPGCGHVFHSHCVVNFAQFDCRCPVCRRQPDGVERREPQGGGSARAVVTSLAERFGAVVTVVHSEEEEQQSAPAVAAVVDLGTIVRRYNRRRRQFLNANPNMRRSVDRLKVVQKDLSAAVRAAEKTYEQKCKRVWKEDPDVTALKNTVYRLRRRERDLTRRIHSVMAQNIGVDPQSYFS